MPTLLTTLAGGDESRSAAADLGLAILRIGTGLMMACGHGQTKVPPKAGFVELVGGLGFPLPEVFAWAAGLAELGGGLLIAAGLCTRPAALVLAFTMAVAAFMQHGADPLFFRDGPSKELAVLYLLAAIAFSFAGGGRWSIDALLRRRVQAPVGGNH